MKGGKRKDIYDVVIIGGGPAGTSAALYAARGGLSVCIVHNGASALEKAERIQNFYGAGTVAGKALFETGIAQAAAVGADMIEAEVTFASRGDDNDFIITTTAGTLNAKRLVIATGASRRTLDIDGLKEYEGKGVSYCAVCDAFFCRNKRVAVVGAGEYAKHEYGALIAVASKTYILTNGETPTFCTGCDGVIEKKIKRVIG
ncbi:MAG: NAD(P)/FAD-dependent oxidoreductase [Clostridiales bacterium]|nr:NAD(P)/FAD-dependent oxidoreductase [Clostridiales bacterium]